MIRPNTERIKEKKQKSQKPQLGPRDKNQRTLQQSLHSGRGNEPSDIRDDDDAQSAIPGNNSIKKGQIVESDPAVSNQSTSVLLNNVERSGAGTDGLDRCQPMSLDFNTLRSPSEPPESSGKTVSGSAPDLGDKSSEPNDNEHESVPDSTSEFVTEYRDILKNSPPPKHRRRKRPISPTESPTKQCQSSIKERKRPRGVVEGSSGTLEGSTTQHHDPPKRRPGRPSNSSNLLISEKNQKPMTDFLAAVPEQSSSITKLPSRITEAPSNVIKLSSNVIEPLSDVTEPLSSVTAPLSHHVSEPSSQEIGPSRSSIP